MKTALLLCLASSAALADIYIVDAGPVVWLYCGAGLTCTRSGSTGVLTATSTDAGASSGTSTPTPYFLQFSATNDDNAPRWLCPGNCLAPYTGAAYSTAPVAGMVTRLSVNSFGSTPRGVGTASCFLAFQVETATENYDGGTVRQIQVVFDGGRGDGKFVHESSDTPGTGNPSTPFFVDAGTLIAVRWNQDTCGGTVGPRFNALVTVQP